MTLLACVVPAVALADATPSARGKLAESALNRKLSKTQKQAVQRAHLVGSGDAGRDGTPAGIGNYTWKQLRRKATILKRARFSLSERRTLMKRGIVGEEATFSTRWVLPSKLRADIFRRIGDKYGVYIKYGREDGGVFGQYENHHIQVYGNRDRRMELAAMVELEKVFRDPKQLDRATIWEALGGVPQ